MSSKKKEKKIPIGVSMPPSLLKRIDKERGLVPRSTYIAHKVEEALKRKKRGS